jgi:uncharacterized membrane protein
MSASSSQPARVRGLRGASWIRDGWDVFCATPGMWLVLTLIWLAIQLAVQMVPFVGFLVALLIAPALCGGLLSCARDSLAERTPDVGQLFDPITEASRRNPVLVQGALFALANLVVMAITLGLVMGTVGSAMWEHHARMMGPGGLDARSIDHAAMMDMVMPVVLAALVGVSLQLIIWALFFYAIPLVLFDGVGQGEALATSGRAVLRNWLALLVFGVLWLGLAIAATIPLLLGWLVLIPMTFGAWLASYRDILGARGSTAAPDDNDAADGLEVAAPTSG